MYKYEIHVHTCGCSGCGRSTAEEQVYAAKEAGYAGLCFTNHFYHGNTCIDRRLPWKDFFGAYYEDYLKGKEAGDKLGIDVFFGLEEAFLLHKEVLIYGVSPEAYLACEGFLSLDMKQMYAFIKENGGFCAVAHPFRHRDYITDPEVEPDLRFFDAIEAFNQENLPEDNEHAFAFAAQHDFPVIAGGDVHKTERFGRSGLAFPERLYTEESFVSHLKSGDYKLIKNGIIEE